MKRLIAAGLGVALLALAGACAGNAPEWTAQPASQGEPLRQSGESLLLREYQDLEQVAEETDVVALVTVASQRVEPTSGLPFTYSTVTVIEASGEVPPTFEWVQTGEHRRAYIKELPPLALVGQTYLAAFRAMEWQGRQIYDVAGPAVWVVERDIASLYATEHTHAAPSIPRVTQVEQLFVELSQG